MRGSGATNSTRPPWLRKRISSARLRRPRLERPFLRAAPRERARRVRTLGGYFSFLRAKPLFLGVIDPSRPMFGREEPGGSPLHAILRLMWPGYKWYAPLEFIVDHMRRSQLPSTISP